MHMLRNIDRQRFRMDFLTHTEEPCAFDDEARSLGSRIIPCPHPRRPLRYARRFRRVLRQYGPYDIVHSHVLHYSGYVLRLVHRAGIRGRIAHSHNVLGTQPEDTTLLRRAYLRQTEAWIRRHATKGLACSRAAARALYGPDWQKDPRWQTLYYGIDLAPFESAADPSSVRAELKLPADAFIVGHVGSFCEQKNHEFFLQVAAKIVEREPNAYFLLVGDGPLQKEIEQQAAGFGLAKRTVFAGSRPDVARLMRGAMDVFLFPSRYEGLGLVLVEAQASGLPCIFPDILPGEASLIQPLVHRLSLSKPATDWAEAVLAQRNGACRIGRSEAVAAVRQSAFNLQNGVSQLEDVYLSCVTDPETPRVATA